MPEKYLSGAMASEIGISDDDGNVKQMCFEDKIRKRERDEKAGVIAPREVALVIDGGKFGSAGQLSKKEYAATVGQAAFAPPPKGNKATRTYKKNPYINEEANAYVASSRRNHKLDLTPNAPESKFLQQQAIKSGRSARP